MEEVARQVYVRTLDLFKAIDACHDLGLPAPTLILLYSTIDILASLDIPPTQANVNRSDFIRWVTTYLLPESDLTLSAEEVYSARCGLLHTLSAESSITRRPDCPGRRLIYYWGNAPRQVLDDAVANSERTPSDAVIDVVHLMAALANGATRFGVAISNDQQLADRVATNLKRVLVHIPFSGPRTPASQ